MPRVKGGKKKAESGVPAVPAKRGRPRRKAIKEQGKISCVSTWALST